MTLPSTMVAVLAYNLGRPEGQVTSYVRRLREAGMITQKGRGRGSARMTSRDALRVVLGLAASDEAVNAPAHVEVAEASILMSEGAVRIGEVMIARGALFGDVLEALVEAYRGDRESNASDAIKAWRGFSASIKSGGMLCEIDFDGSEGSPFQFLAPSDLDLRNKGKVYSQTIGEKDLRTIRVFSRQTLSAICSCTVPPSDAEDC